MENSLFLGSPTRWTRPLNGMEGYFNFIGHYTLLSKVRMELDMPDLRYQQPQISAKADNMELVYEVADETHVLIKQATLYYIAASSELFLRIHHTLINGTGVRLFWHSFFNMLGATLSHITFGDEHVRLPPVLEEVLGNSEQPTPEQADRAAALLGPVSKLGTAPSGCSRNREYIFSAQKTAAVIKAFEDRSISVRSPLHAAYIQIITKYADPTANVSRYANVNSLSLRPYLPEPYNTSGYAVSVYYAAVPFILDTPATFSEAATALHEHYQTGFKSNTANREICGYMACMLRDIVSTPEFQGKPILRDALFSSLDIMEEHLERAYGTTVTVKDFMFGAETVLGISMLFISMFHNELRPVYSFNDGFEEESDVQMYLEDIDRMSTEELFS
ncbi:hypothetical protein BDV34DRAFT_208445 [Aspergillus parasiticus]|uniref:Uncharacterized protein n=1 Tax=Aspergillus parasiticus TaxID=5067 RepID=A0A5N6E327_ASPPA|nr:hypothetical protein BDV34DRAFT_208445 [Aspergillus parasiticus]